MMKKLKPIYATTERVDGHAVVRGIYPWLWMAKLMSRADRLELAIIPQDPQDIINICEHRDEALTERAVLLDTIFGLVARDDDGNWTTVHNADTRLPDEAGAIISTVLA